MAEAGISGGEGGGSGEAAPSAPATPATAAPTPAPSAAPRRHVARAALALLWRSAPLEAAAGVFVTVLQGLLPAAGAWIAKLLFDELARGRALDIGRATWLVGAGAALTVLGVVLNLVGSQVARRSRRAVTLRAQDELYRAVSGLPGLRSFEDPVFQDRLRLAEQGAQSAPTDVDAFLTETVRNTVGVLGYLGALLAVWPPMALVLLLTAVPAAVAQRALARRRAQVTEDTMATLRRRFFFQQLLTDATAAKEVRLFGLGPLFHRRMLAALRESTDAELAVEGRGSRLQSGLALLAAAVAALGTIVVIHGVAAGRVTIGGLTLFTAAVAGVQSASSAVINQAAQAGRTMRLFRSYLEVVGTPPDVASGTGEVTPLRHGVEFQDVWFRYHDSAPWVLRGVNLVVPAGQSVGLVGLNGAGKSTLVKLLCRFYEPDRGRILWDGVDVRELAIDQLRAALGATFQDFCRYDLTAAENVGVGDVDRIEDRDAIRRAALAAGIDGTLSGLRDGYDTLLSRLFFDEDRQHGLALSGGQWQRVAIARSLMRHDASLLILDEPSAGLDAEAEHEIHRTLAARRAGRTSLLISHRLGAMREADVIVVLEEGRVVEQGTHDELLSTDSRYARLFLLQAEGYQLQAEGYRLEPEGHPETSTAAGTP
ncbi:ATP-binding cassette subfamily B protein [Catenulispora sp. MAP12-49]|uniref:ABC transporter ATP-binding protein n=1 Tax=Catenulispora sp. MAP12-49 TaxID=3156302 RepID=UPI0035118189